MRRIPDDNLSYPLSITLSSGAAGSAFVVDADPHVYLVTARHVVFATDGATLLAAQATVTGYNRTLPGSPRVVLELALDQLLAANALRPHPTNDIAVVRIGTLAAEPKAIRPLTYQAGIRAVDAAGANLVGISLKHNTKRFADVLEANEVVVFGYPVSLGLASVPQLDLAKPLLRHGIIAAKNEALRTIILDCPVYPGNSGGPVLEIEIDGAATYFHAIGVVSQFVPAAERWVNQEYGYANLSLSNSGYSVAVPFDVVDEVIARF